MEETASENSATYVTPDAENTIYDQQEVSYVTGQGWQYKNYHMNPNVRNNPHRFAYPKLDKPVDNAQNSQGENSADISTSCPFANDRSARRDEGSSNYDAAVAPGSANSKESVESVLRKTESRSKLQKPRKRIAETDRPTSLTMTRASSPGEHDRVAGRLAGELDRGTDQLAWRARPILRGPFRTRSHPITMHLRPKFP
ncbi:hypothetical protein DY000_02015853 [Brassica cretica]|uniref:DUF4005 domain-containing protein n=1 Tax=Brassica cretica TaxID=69181 RepID=A0ABQ7CX79_BRACR|nr:hypothetical protein DY000_02015853 [Brassica cretica]